MVLNVFPPSVEYFRYTFPVFSTTLLAPPESAPLGSGGKLFATPVFCVLITNPTAPHCATPGYDLICGSLMSANFAVFGKIVCGVLSGVGGKFSFFSRCAGCGNSGYGPSVRCVTP